MIATLFFERKSITFRVNLRKVDQDLLDGQGLIVCFVLLLINEEDDFPMFFHVELWLLVKKYHSTYSAIDSANFSIRFSKSDGKTVLLSSNTNRVADRDQILAKIEAQDWNSLYPRMVAHASRRLGWIGLSSKDGALGYDPKNIVSLAVEKLLTGKRLPSEDDFKDFPGYLRNVLNSLIYSLKCKKENKLKDPRDLDGPLADEVFFEKILDDGFLNEYELTLLQEEFENELIKKDEDMFLVYSELCQGKKHISIAESLNKSVSDVENIHKRLNTFIKNYRSKTPKNG